MVTTLVLAVLLSQTATETPVSSQVLTNIKGSLKGATAAALVTVTDAENGRVKVNVDEPVLGDLHGELDVGAMAFNSRDLEQGTQLLVFFRGGVPTGHYELVCSGTIREVPVETYLARVKAEARLVIKAPKAKPAAPIAAARSAPAASR